MSRARLALLFALGALLLSVACNPFGGDSSEAERLVPEGHVLTEQEFANWVDRLTGNDPAQRQLVLQVVEETQDPRFVPVLIDIFAHQLPHVRAQISSVLNGLTGQDLDGTPASWFGWHQWIGAQEFWPRHDDYVGWKGRFLEETRGSAFTRFLKSSRPITIRPELIQYGGVSIDGIPPLDQPQFVAPEDADYLLDGEPVFGVVINGDARAYPLRILDWHEMANDVVGGEPISIAYCTLCGSAVLYRTTVEGEVIEFSTSGLLYESNKLMYDRRTDTLWNQLTGRPVLGPLVGTGIELERLPIVRTTWANWHAQHPSTTVLSIETGFVRTYEPGAAYGDYFDSSTTRFPVAARSDLLPEKSEVYTLLVEGVPRAYPAAALEEELVVNDAVGATPVVLVVEPGTLAVRAYERGALEFAAGRLEVATGEAQTVVDASGTVWRVTEDALVAADGRELPRLGGHLAYWFGWFTFFPHTTVYGLDEAG
jgi:hypothetical protein